PRRSCAPGCRSETLTSRSRRRCARAHSQAPSRHRGRPPGRAASTTRSRRRECGLVPLPFPDTTTIDEGELAIGGLRASVLAERFGTPLVVLDEETLLARARAYREAAPDALVAYSVKALPNLAVLRLLAEQGLGADVSTAGELEYALRAGIDPARIVFHGNNKADDE